MKTYFVIHSSEDGTSLTRLTEDQLIKRLNEGYWGTVTVVTPAILESHARNGTYHVDLRECAGLWIVKGDLVEPKPHKVVETWKL